MSDLPPEETAQGGGSRSVPMAAFVQTFAHNEELMLALVNRMPHEVLLHVADRAFDILFSPNYRADANDVNEDERIITVTIHDGGSLPTDRVDNNPSQSAIRHDSQDAPQVEARGGGTPEPEQDLQMALDFQLQDRSSTTTAMEQLLVRKRSPPLQPSESGRQSSVPVSQVSQSLLPRHSSVPIFSASEASVSRETLMRDYPAVAGPNPKPASDSPQPIVDPIAQIAKERQAELDILNMSSANEDSEMKDTSADDDKANGKKGKAPRAPRPTNPHGALSQDRIAAESSLSRTWKSLEVLPSIVEMLKNSNNKIDWDATSDQPAKMKTASAYKIAIKTCWGLDSGAAVTAKTYVAIAMFEESVLYAFTDEGGAQALPTGKTITRQNDWALITAKSQEEYDQMTATTLKTARNRVSALRRLSRRFSSFVDEWGWGILVIIPARISQRHWFKASAEKVEECLSRLKNEEEAAVFRVFASAFAEIEHRAIKDKNPGQRASSMLQDRKKIVITIRQVLNHDDLTFNSHDGHRLLPPGFEEHWATGMKSNSIRELWIDWFDDEVVHIERKY